MGKINLGRVILGGLLAGVIVNVGEFLLHEKVVKEKEMAAMAAMGRTGTGELWVWIVWAFLYGVALVWLYAAMRPRFGAGAKTAVIAGVAAWFFACLLPAVSMINLGFMARDLVMIVGAWDLVLTIAAALAGGWLYREA